MTGTGKLGIGSASASGSLARAGRAGVAGLDSYGRVDNNGAAVDPEHYSYRRAARDAIHFPKIVDRFWQNTRRCVGWDVQYFGTVEPQRRGAPHFHAAIRGTIPRATSSRR